jgi:alkylhydroperoxidase family enzyme
MSPQTRPDKPRIEPLAADKRTESEVELLESVTSGDSRAFRGTRASNIFQTLVHNQELFSAWLPFARELLDGKLAARDRELAVLRVGWLCQSEYEWGHHVRLARHAGITDAEIERVKEGPDAVGWSELEEALLRAVDELHSDACISGNTWSVLADNYSEPELIELTMLIGQYHLVAFTLNSLGIQREDQVASFSLE